MVFNSDNHTGYEIKLRKINVNSILIRGLTIIRGSTSFALTDAQNY